MLSVLKATVEVYSHDGTFVCAGGFTDEVGAVQRASELGEVKFDGLVAGSTAMPEGAIPSVSTSGGLEQRLSQLALDSSEQDGRRRTVHVFVVQLPPVPERNPLHPKALTLEDIRPVLVMQPYLRRHKDGGQLTVVDYPHFGRLSGDCSELKVKITERNSRDGEIVVYEKYLADLGVVPYGGGGVWNPYRYTLAAD